jgi:hypothetical protein
LEWPIFWQEYFNRSVGYIRDPMNQNQSSDRYWRQIGLILAQFDGLLNGTNANLPPSARLRALNLWICQSAGDLDEVAEALGYPHRDVTLKGTGFLRVDPAIKVFSFRAPIFTRV